MSSSSPSQRLRPAAGILIRRAGDASSVYLVERRPELAFFGGYHAFPGGVVENDDGDVPIAGRLHEGGLEPPVERRWVAAAARELFEETGILVATGGRALDPDERARARDRLTSGAERFGALLSSAGLAVDANRILPLCRTITPIFSPARYDTVFFLVDQRPGDEPSVLPTELASGAFVTARDALARWLAGEILIVPPAIILLKLLVAAAGEPERAEDPLLHRGAAAIPVSRDSLDLDPVTRRFLASASRLSSEYGRGKIHQVYFSPGIQKATLRTSTRPPANHTNAYFIGEASVFLVDPGAEERDEQERLFEAMDEVIAQGRRFVAVLLTHHHPDHVGAVPEVAARYGLPVWAHRETGRALEGRIAVARTLEDGETIALGASPDGRPGWTLTILHTPGHAPGHLAFQESRYHALVVGDLVSTVSTILISPPEGHMATYLDSLRRLRALPKGTLYPAHGPAKRDSHATLDAYLAHRARREEKVLGALGGAYRSLDEILAIAYDDVEEAALPLARRSLLAGLAKLVEEGRAEERAGDYRKAGAQPPRESP